MPAAITIDIWMREKAVYISSGVLIWSVFLPSIHMVLSVLDKNAGIVGSKCAIVLVDYYLLDYNDLNSIDFVT